MTDLFCDNEILSAARLGGAAVCGVGVSNVPLIDFLLERGIRVVARDKKNREQFGGDFVEGLCARGVELVLGDGYLDDIREAVIFRTPGLRPDHPSLMSAVERGAILTSEMELFLELTPARTIGITGSDGKTTTTTLTYKFLEAQLKKEGKGKVYVGGNIGEPLLPRVAKMTAEDFAVIELSSFQLMTMKRSPSVAAVTNLSPNHLDWHKSGMAEYAEAKTNIYRHGAARLTVNAESAPTLEMGEHADVAEKIFFSSKKSAYDEVVPSSCRGAKAIFERDGYIVVSDGENEMPVLKVAEIFLPGRHNVENYMTAIGNTLGIVSCDVREAIAGSFGGVEHRLEFVRELDGVKYYNSSIDSSPSRTAAVLSALPQKPVVICGGYDKNIPFEPLAQALCRGAVGVVLTGDTADKIYGVLTAYSEFDPEKLTVKKVDDFDGAVIAARDMAEGSGIVLLSPACASFDRFKNFMERGRYFKELVMKL